MGWYHGGDLEKGTPKGKYLFVTDSLGFAKLHAKGHGTDKVYCLRAEYDHLVEDHPTMIEGTGKKCKVILQAALKNPRGALAFFEKVTG